MVMVTRSSRRRACEIFDDTSSDNACNVPPWCSSGKSYEKRKPGKIPSSPIYEVQSPYFSPTNLRKIPSKDKSEHSSNGFRKRKIKSCRERNRDGIGKCRRDAFLMSFFVSVCFGMLLYYWMFGTSKLSSQNEVLSLMGLDKTSLAIDEECCYKMKQLAAALLQAEQTIRRTRRQQTLMLTAQTTKLAESTTRIFEPDLIQGAVARMGGGTSPWGVGAALWGVVPLWRASPPPQTLLADRRPQPADCWPFSGSRGEVVIELPGQHRVRRISIQHVRPDAARSAPRHFSFYGISENGTWIKGLSGEYTYDGPAKQYFTVLHELPNVNKVVLRVLSNHGNTKYTCIYRVHIYGSLNKILL